jgi:hypothetical protein
LIVVEVQGAVAGLIEVAGGGGRYAQSGVEVALFLKWRKKEKGKRKKEKGKRKKEKGKRKKPLFPFLTPRPRRTRGCRT